MFDPLLLKTFVAVVEEQGFGRAAEKLHLTQPAVSGHLRRLEEQVCKPLLKRTTRSQELTLEGDRLMRHARIISFTLRVGEYSSPISRFLATCCVMVDPPRARWPDPNLLA